MSEFKDRGDVGGAPDSVGSNQRLGMQLLACGVCAAIVKQLAQPYLGATRASIAAVALLVLAIGILVVRARRGRSGGR